MNFLRRIVLLLSPLKGSLTTTHTLEAHCMLYRPNSKDFYKQQTAAAGKKLLEPSVSDEEDSDSDLDNYIRRWRRSRDEDIVHVLKALRRENKLLKKKLKKERLRIGLELRRVYAANKVSKQRNVNFHWSKPIMNHIRYLRTKTK